MTRQQAPDLEALTVRFFDALDRRDYATCVGLLAPDGVWERQDGSVRGHEAVLRALDKRAADRRTCHVVTNLFVTMIDASRARVDFILTAYEGHEGADGAAPAARLAGIRRCVDEMTLTAEGWRIAHKSSEAILKGA